MRMLHTILLCLGLALPCTAGAQAVFKCLDDRSVTYSSTPCQELGLKSGGEIKDRVTTVPAVKRPAATATEQKKPSLATSEDGVEAPKTPALKPVNPLLEKQIK